MSFNKDDLSRISNVCTPIRDLITYIENTYDLVITSSTLLRQSTSGIEGAKEAIFGWHQDNDEKQLNTYMTFIILLNDKATSMQVKGYKMLQYDGKGCCACFYRN